MLTSDKFGYINAKYEFDFGYKGSNDYQVNKDTKIVSYNMAIGLYSKLDFELNVNLFGMIIRNLKLEIVPLSYNPISITGSWTHPIGTSQGQDMSGLIDFGYDWNFGDVQLKYITNNLVPQVSILDYILDNTKKWYPSLLPG